MSRFELYLKVVRDFVTGRTVGAGDIGESYDKVSGTYDSAFIRVMQQYNVEMLAKVNVSQSARVLDLACGTGVNSEWFLKRHQNVQIDGVDISKGMLERAATKLGDKANLYHMTMLDYLHQCPNHLYDSVVCGWALKYQSPVSVLKECRRVLKPHGRLGVILNTKSTLPEVRKVYRHLLMHNSSHVKKLMVELPNPKNKAQLAEWFAQAGLKSIEIKENAHVFRFNTSADAVSWVTSTGALAGFDIMLNLHDAEIQKQMVDWFDHYGFTTVTHKFVWGIAEK